MGPSIREIAELNIHRYRDLLKSVTDLTKRRTITNLLAEEEAKIARLQNEQQSPHGRSARQMLPPTPLARGGNQEPPGS